MASCSAGGICTSRISTDCTVMPHGVVFSSRMRCSSWPIISRSATIWCSSCRPIDSRSAVCALNSIACVEVLHFQNRFLRVPHHPEHDRVHIHRHRVARQRRFRRDVGHAHPLVHIPAQRVDHRDHVKHPGPAQSDVPARNAAPPPSPTDPPPGSRTAGTARPALRHDQPARVVASAAESAAPAASANHQAAPHPH